MIIVKTKTNWTKTRTRLSAVRNSAESHNFSYDLLTVRYIQVDLPTIRPIILFEKYLIKFVCINHFFGEKKESKRNCIKSHDTEPSFLPVSKNCPLPHYVHCTLYSMFYFFVAVATARRICQIITLSTASSAISKSTLSDIIFSVRYSRYCS